ncbi:hypothetical protein ABVT39_002948 [Epinephelus coioides]
MFLGPAKAAGAGKKTGLDCSPQAPKDREVKNMELQLLANPVESLSDCFKILSLDDWMKDIDSLKIIRALAQHHSEILKTKLHEVCLVLIGQRTMDPEVEGTGQAFLLKLASSTNDFIQQQANIALDVMVANCSHGCILSALLNTGLSHRCVAVRGSMTQHLHQLADSLRAARVLAAGRTFTECFLLVVSKMCVDGAPEVSVRIFVECFHSLNFIFLNFKLIEKRIHPQAPWTNSPPGTGQKDFLNLWTKIDLDNERRSSLDKDLKKAK